MPEAKKYRLSVVLERINGFPVTHTRDITEFTALPSISADILKDSVKALNILIDKHYSNLKTKKGD